MPSSRLVRARHHLLAVGLSALALVIVRTLVMSEASAMVRASSLPDVVGLAAAVAVGCGWMAITQRHRPGWLHAAVAASLANGILAGVLWWDPGALRSSHFDRWVPWLAGAGALTWAGGWALERWTRQRWASITSVLCALAVAGAALSTARRTPEALAGDTPRVWNIYHYYAGAKYFGALGYTDLYAATLAADTLVAHEHPKRRNLQHVRRTRDLTTYQPTTRAQAIGELGDRVDEATLRALYHDVQGLLPLGSKKLWQRMLGDLGYNPAPPWTVVGQPLARALDTRGWQRRLLTNLDLPLYAASLLAVLWAWGPRMAAGMTLYVTLVSFNEERLVGGLLQYDWLASLLVGVALWRRGRPVAAGIVLSWGAMTRVFVGFLVLPALFVGVWQALRTRHVPWRAPRVRLLTGFTAACLGWFALSHTTGRGLHTWPEWVQAISLHSQLHPYDGNKRLGLARLGAHQPRASDLLDAHPRTTRPEEAAALAARIRPWQLVAALCVLAVAARRRPLDRALWMLALVWVVVTTSRYYGSSWAVLLALGLPDQGDAGREQSPAGVLAATSVLLLPWLCYQFDDAEPRYIAINYWMAVTFAAVAAWWGATDTRAAWVGRTTRPPRHRPDSTSPMASRVEKTNSSPAVAPSTGLSAGPCSEWTRPRSSHASGAVSQGSSTQAP